MPARSSPSSSTRPAGPTNGRPSMSSRSPGLLADEHQPRLAGTGPRAHHRLRRALPQLAGAALLHGLAQRLEARGARGSERLECVGSRRAGSSLSRSRTPAMKPARIGCSGWNYADWRGGFYPQREPQRRWLELYAQRFDTVEVNTTFYRLPRRDAVAPGWRRRPTASPSRSRPAATSPTSSASPTSVRGWRASTSASSRSIEAGRLGPVLWQLPGNFHRDDARLHDWLEALPDGLHTIEFRHASWFAPPVMRALREHGGRADHRRPPRASVPDPRGDRRLAVRPLSLRRRGRGGNYSATEIEQWARRIAQWRRRQARVGLLQQRLARARARQRRAARPPARRRAQRRLDPGLGRRGSRTGSPASSGSTSSR